MDWTRRLNHRDKLDVVVVDWLFLHVLCNFSKRCNLTECFKGLTACAYCISGLSAKAGREEEEKREAAANAPAAAGSTLRCLGFSDGYNRQLSEYVPV